MRWWLEVGIGLISTPNPSCPLTAVTTPLLFVVEGSLLLSTSVVVTADRGMLHESLLCMALVFACAGSTGPAPPLSLCSTDDAVVAEEDTTISDPKLCVMQWEMGNAGLISLSLCPTDCTARAEAKVFAKL